MTLHMVGQALVLVHHSPGNALEDVPVSQACCVIWDTQHYYRLAWARDRLWAEARCDSSAIVILAPWKTLPKGILCPPVKPAQRWSCCTAAFRRSFLFADGIVSDANLLSPYNVARGSVKCKYVIGLGLDGAPVTRLGSESGRLVVRNHKEVCLSNRGCKLGELRHTVGRVRSVVIRKGTSHINVPLSSFAGSSGMLA